MNLQHTKKEARLQALSHTSYHVHAHARGFGAQNEKTACQLKWLHRYAFTIAMGSQSGRHKCACKFALLAFCVTASQQVTAETQCAWNSHMSESQVSGKNTRRVIDISVTIQTELPVWEKPDGLGAHRKLVERQDQGGVAFVSKLTMVVHTGTHFDAPSHFLQEAFDSGRGIEAIQLSIMNGPAVVVDIPHHTNITGALLKTLPIPPGAERVLFKTISSARRLMYQTAFESNYTALTEDGADWVVAAGIKFVGIDYISIATYEELAPAHQSLMRAGIVPVEGLDLSHVEPGLYDVHCLPLKLDGSDGAPGRCILLS